MVFDRRGFLKFAAGATTGIMVTPLPWKLLDDASIWTQNWPWIPSNESGESTYTNVVSKMDLSGVPLRIRLVNGRPVRALPVKDHPLGGGVTALAVTEVQMLHSPARLKRPLLRSSDGGYTEVEWPAAIAMLQEKFTEAKDSVAFISGDETSTTNEVLSAFAAKLGSSDVFLMPSEGQCAARAAELAGVPAQFGYDLENSDYVLAIGANMLESWGTVVRNRRIFKETHPHSVKDNADAAAKATLVYAGSTQNNTAAVAKTWLPVYPGSEGILALGIANMLIDKGRAALASDFGDFRKMVSRISKDELVKRTGVDMAKLEEVVQGLLSAKAPLVIVGSEFNQGLGAASLIAGFAVNVLLRNINRPGGMTLLPLPETVIDGAMHRNEIFKRDLPAWLASGPKPKMLVLHEANPVYALPDPEGVKKAISAIPFKVSFSTFMDETTAMCDLILPIGMTLERVDDLEMPYGCGKGTYCVSTSSVVPVQDVRGTGNVLLLVARQMGNDLGFEFFGDVLRRKTLNYESCSFEVLASGQAGVIDRTVDAYGFSFATEVLEKAFVPSNFGDKLRLAPFAKLNLGSAKTGIPPYNTKTIRSTELDGSLMAVMMNGATASKRGLVDGDKVTLSVGARNVAAKLRVFEGVMNDTVAVCLGYGHTALDEFSQNKGANVMELMTASPEPETGLSVWNKIGVTVSKA